MKEQLDMAAKDNQLIGLVLWINSPGGTVTASDMIYNELKMFKSRQRLPVLALFSGTATSGAYYVAQAADRIVAAPTSVTGSIGVILMNLNLSGLMEKVGVSDSSIKSGLHKDVPAGGVVFGYPALEAGESMRIAAALRRLPDMVRTLNRLEKAIGAQDAAGEDQG